MHRVTLVFCYMVFNFLTLSMFSYIFTISALAIFNYLCYNITCFTRKTTSDVVLILFGHQKGIPVLITHPILPLVPSQQLSQ